LLAATGVALLLARGMTGRMACVSFDEDTESMANYIRNLETLAGYWQRIISSGA
jgi:hypothetical protein